MKYYYTWLFSISYYNFGFGIDSAAFGNGLPWIDCWNPLFREERGVEGKDEAEAYEDVAMGLTVRIVANGGEYLPITTFKALD